MGSSLDIASSEFYRDGAYRLVLEGRALDSDALSAMLIDWLDRYPIVSIEDPLAEHDAAASHVSRRQSVTGRKSWATIS